MMRLNVDYTKQQVMQDIKAIEELREEDIKLPLAVIRREEPVAYKTAYYKEYKRARRNTPEHKESQRQRMRLYHQTQEFKDYIKARNKAFHILKERHKEEFEQIFNELKTKN